MDARLARVARSHASGGNGNGNGPREEEMDRARSRVPEGTGQSAPSSRAARGRGPSGGASCLTHIRVGRAFVCSISTPAYVYGEFRSPAAFRGRASRAPGLGARLPPRRGRGD